MSTSSDSPSDFDPYLEWLGLSPDQRPYHHYCLLGLKPFENDRQVISTAAQRTMAELRKRRHGATAAEAQRLIAQLSQATTCLLNSNRKRLYDRHLHDSLDDGYGTPSHSRASNRSDESKTAGRPSLPSRNPAAVAETAVAGTVSSSNDRSRPPAIVASPPKRVRSTQIPLVRSRNPALLGAGIGATLLLVLVVAAGLMRGKRGEPHETGGRVQPVAAAGRPTATSTVALEQARSASRATDAATPSTVAAASAGLPDASFADFGSPDSGARAFELPAGSGSLPPSSPATLAETSLPPEVPLPFSAADDQPKALRFTGTDRIALSQPLTSLNFAKPFTLEMWVRFDKGTYAHWLMGDLVFGNAHPQVPAGVTAGWQAWIMQTEGGKQRFAIATGKGFWAEYPAVDEAWRHLAVSGDGATVAIYVDGRRAAIQSAATLAEHHVPSPLPLHFGSHNFMHPTQPAGLQGQIRAARISTACRYRENFTPPPTFDCDESAELVYDFRHAASSRRIDDLSRHARHGTLWGAQWLVMSEADFASATAVAVAAPAISVPDAAAPEPAAPEPAAPDLTATASGAEPVTSAKSPAPPEAELQAARQRIETLLAAEIAAAKRPAEHLALAVKLVSLAGESTDDRAAQFVLFEMAAERLAQGHDLSKSLKVIDDFASHFEIDRLTRRAAMIRSTGSGPLAPAQRQELAEAALQAGEEMKRAGRFQLAESVAQTAVTAATRIRSQELGRRARQLRDEAKRSSHLEEEAEQARIQLAAAPDDPTANRTYGKFLCLQMNKWAAGAVLLAKSDDEALKQAAAAELKAVHGAEAQAAAAELWYAARTAIDKNDLVPLLEHVLDLSRRAAPDLKGIARLSIEKRMQEIAAELPAAPASAGPQQAAIPRFEPPPEFQSLVGRLQVDGRDASVLWKYRTGLRLTDGNVNDILMQAGIPRGRVQLDFVGKLNLLETTTVNVMHQGGSPLDATATLYVDGKLVGALGGEHASSDVYKLDLAKGEHTVAWQLAGRDLATNSLQFTDAAAAMPLVIYHDAVLLKAVSETPSRARLTVDLVGGLK